jgi:hypothetical protein
VENGELLISDFSILEECPSPLVLVFDYLRWVFDFGIIKD